MANLRLTTSMALLVLLSVAAAYAAKDLPPLTIAKQGYVFAGAKYSTVNDRRVMTGQIYAEYQIPAKQTHRWPVLMVHGLGQSGTNFTGTPDGREGWAQYFLRQGYAVYIIDQPGRGRAAWQQDVNSCRTRCRRWFIWKRVLW